ncbi:hypothetical protein OH76DRAFT_1488952 [Lentinus brumalis]|uniref:Uncharacterized protein n=1 Tax=Lentinus brumalis TaxID=2498619 RepID=A0A371CPA0_9APHY|nr:hypothetical protein OH76DRAFT_1488952 [Polyporus brumalis]
MSRDAASPFSVCIFPAMMKTKSWEKIKSLRRARSSGSIYDPDGTDLSVVDLPGLIQHDRTGAVDLYLTLMHIFAVLDDGTSEGHAGGERETCEGKVYYVQASSRHARPATHHGLTGGYSVRESDLMKLFDAALPMHHEQANKLSCAVSYASTVFRNCWHTESLRLSSVFPSSPPTWKRSYTGTDSPDCPIILSFVRPKEKTDTGELKNATTHG